MNLYVTSESPSSCAKFLCDQMLGQAVVDSSNILHSVNDYMNNTRTEAGNHILSCWCRETRGNYIWTLEYFESLCKEFNNRFKQGHPLLTNLVDLENNMIYVPQGVQTPFINNAVNYNEDVDFSFLTDVYDAYKLMLNTLWEKSKNPPTWNNKRRNF